MNNKCFFVVLLLHLFIIEGNTQIAQRMDSLALIHQAKGFNGNVLYSKNDSVIFSGNYGYRDFDTQEVLNDSSIFELASNTKQFTAVAIIQLVERGLLQYQTKVQELLKDFPYREMTVEHLLRHQSGLPDNQKLLADKKLWDRKRMATAQDVVDLLSTHKPSLLFESGNRYDYSNTGYNVLAVIIERLSGLAYNVYLKENIFKPAGMLTADVVVRGNDPEMSQNVAKGHTHNNRKKVYQKADKDKNHRHLKWMRTIAGGAGIYASVLDIEKWKRALRENTLITKESKKKMMTPDEVSVKYGFGVAIYDATSKGKWVYHTGSWGGAKTMILYLPESNELLVILSNNRYANTYKTFDEDLYALLQE